MKQFFKYILINFLAIPIIGIIVVAISVAIKTSPTEANLSMAYAKEVNGYGWVTKVKNVKGFVFGSSSLRYGVSSNTLAGNDSTWINFSMDARDPIVFYNLLIKYYPISKPNTVLIGLDPWIFSKRYYKFKNKVMYLDLNGSEITNFIKLDKFSPIQRLKEYVSARFSNKQTENTGKLYNYNIPDDLGSVSLNRSAKNFTKINEDWFEINKYGWSEIEFSYLKKIDDFCKEKNINAIFLIPPKRDDYTKVAQTKFLSENKAWWQKVSTTIPGANVLGSFAILKNQNQDSVFAEAYHLNKAGQIIYSNYLKNNLYNSSKINPSYNIFESSIK